MNILMILAMLLLPIGLFSLVMYLIFNDMDKQYDEWMRERENERNNQ